MKYRLRTLLVVLAALALAVGMVGLAGCKKAENKPSSQGGNQPVNGGTMSFYIGEPAYIDPFNTQESEGTQVEQSLFDSLTRVDPLDPTKLGPAAARSWDTTDSIVWTFNLDPDDKFSDGSPVTANDFVYAWTRIVDPKTRNTLTGKVDASIISYHLGFVKGFDELQSGAATGLAGVEAVDDNTFRVTLSKPFADFPFVAAHPALAPVPRKYVEGGVPSTPATGSASASATVPYGDMPIGNGPFKMAEPWKHNQFIRVVRNENYYGTKPHLDGVQFKIYKDPESAYTDFLAGNIDFCQIGQGKIKDAEKSYGTSANGYTVNPGKQALLGAENATYYLIANMTDPVFKNEHMRMAVSLAINRQAICDTVFEGTREPADNIIPPGIAGYEKGVWMDARYDVEEAKMELEKAGFPGGKGLSQIRLSFNSGGGHEKIMELVQSDLKKIGITAVFNSSEFPTYLKQLDAGNFQIARLGWIADYPIADNFLYPLFQSKSGDNKSKFTSSSVDANLDAARKIKDDAQRIKAYQDINQAIQAENPVLPLMFYKHHHIGSKRLHDFTFDPQGLADFGAAWVK